jgi:hypothetical protein
VKRALIVTLVVLASMGGGWEASACSCAPLTPAAALKEADVAFSGLVTAVVDGPAAEGRRRVTFEVDGVYKGDLAEITHVETPTTAEACGIDFVPSSRYTVLAQQEGDALVSQVCDATSTDPSVLDPVATPRPPTVLAAETAEDPDGGGGFPFLNVVAVIVGALAITAWRRRGRTHGRGS